MLREGAGVEERKEERKKERKEERSISRPGRFSGGEERFLVREMRAAMMKERMMMMMMKTIRRVRVNGRPIGGRNAFVIKLYSTRQ